MSHKTELVVVKDYEREKIYRLNRRLDGLSELLEMINNTKIKFTDPKRLKKDIEKDISDCNFRIQKWWNIIVSKYKLPMNQALTVAFVDGCIYKTIDE